MVTLPVPAGFDSQRGALWDIISHPDEGDLVVGEAWHPSSGDHVQLWKPAACGQ